MSLMVSISGIRGVVGESLTPEIAVKYAAAFGQYCRQHTPGKPLVIVGRDGRITGGMVSDLIISTLLSTGVNVRSLDICPTPTVQLAVEHGRAAGGISVTASHNPMQWNGMKFVASTGMFLDAGENAALWKIAEQRPAYAPWTDIGGLSPDSAWIQKHIEAVLSLPMFEPETIRERGFRVVVDCVNAAGGVIVPGFLRTLGCDVMEMNCDVSGIFSHTPEPIPENLTDLAARVRAERADLGIAVDPDVDRLVLIMEDGEPYSEEYTVASAVKFVLGKTARTEPTPQTVVVNLSTTRAVEDIAREYGARVLRTPVGEINVAKAMKESGAVIGGEGSGGVILPAVHYGRDAIVGIACILQLLAESGQSLRQLKASLPGYEIAKGKVALGSISPGAALGRIRAANEGKGRITTTDGLKIDFPDSWVHLRASNTEPIIRIIAEARSAASARELVNQFTRALQTA